MPAPQFNRRNLLQGAAAAFMVPMLPRRVGAEQNCRVSSRVFVPSPQIAVSLKKIAAAACKSGACASKFNPMGGMTRLDGLVVDAANRDLILWGLKEDDAPELMFDDFVVAIRAAYGEYAVNENGRMIIYQPGISIDADYERWMQIDELGSLGNMEARARYVEICETPMKLRVDGMPRHTRVADILLAADYRMKLVNEGAAAIPIDNFFKSLAERRYERTRVGIMRNASYHQPIYDIGRYWFSAGEFSYQTSGRGDTLFLDKAQVILNHQAERVVNGQLVSAGLSVPEVEAFVCDWNDRMEDTFEAEVIWREMYNVFRHFALARLIADNRLLEAAGFDDRALLKSHRIARVEVPAVIGGLGIVQEEKFNNWTWYSTLCGGVSVDVSDRLQRSASLDPAAMTDAGQRVLSSIRGKSGSFSWEVSA